MKRSHRLQIQMMWNRRLIRIHIQHFKSTKKLPNFRKWIYWIHTNSILKRMHCSISSLSFSVVQYAKRSIRGLACVFICLRMTPKIHSLWNVTCVARNFPGRKLFWLTSRRINTGKTLTKPNCPYHVPYAKKCKPISVDEPILIRNRSIYENTQGMADKETWEWETKWTTCIQTKCSNCFFRIFFVYFPFRTNSKV